MSAVAIDSEGHTLYLIQRHGLGHKTPPHSVNYKAMALGLSELRVECCLSTAAVGSLREDWGPRTLAVCSDFIDLTGRNLTLFERDVIHTDFSHPFGPRSRAALLTAAQESGAQVRSEAVYLGNNGPRYETPAEIRMDRMLGADVVGMTATSEAILMREAGVDYGCLAVVTNLAAGISPTELHHGEVVDIMNEMGDAIVRLLLGAAKRLTDGD